MLTATVTYLSDNYWRTGMNACHFRLRQPVRCCKQCAVGFQTRAAATPTLVELKKLVCFSIFSRLVRTAPGISTRSPPCVACSVPPTCCTGLGQLHKSLVKVCAPDHAVSSQQKGSSACQHLAHRAAGPPNQTNRPTGSASEQAEKCVLPNQCMLLIMNNCSSMRTPCLWMRYFCTTINGSKISSSATAGSSA